MEKDLDEGVLIAIWENMFWGEFKIVTIHFYIKVSSKILVGTTESLFKFRIGIVRACILFDIFHL